jgi:hypothetical protein
MSALIPTLNVGLHQVVALAAQNYINFHYFSDGIQSLIVHFPYFW